MFLHLLICPIVKQKKEKTKKKGKETVPITVLPSSKYFGEDTLAILEGIVTGKKKIIGEKKESD